MRFTYQMSVYPQKGGSAAPPGYDVAFSLGNLADVAASQDASIVPAGIPITAKQLSKKRKRPGERCWGCENAFGTPVDIDADPLMFGFNDLYDTLKATASKEFMYEQLAKFHSQHVTEKKLQAKEECIPWPVDMVRIHIEAHVLNAHNEHMHSLDFICTMEREMENLLLRMHQGETRPELKAVEEWRKIVGLKKQFLFSNRSSMYRM